MQFRHWSALGPSQPWSPHSGWQGPAGDTSSGRGTEAEEGPPRAGRAQPVPPQAAEHGDTSHCAHRGGGQGICLGLGLFFSSPAASGTNLWRQPQIYLFFFPHLLISPSCCPTHHSSSLPTSPGPPSSSQFMFWGYLGALTRVLLLLLRHLHLALQEGHPRRLHLRGLRRPHAGLGAPQRVVGVLGRPVEEEAPLLQLPWGARALSPHAHPAPHFAPSSAPPKVLTPHLKFWIKMG